MEKRFAATLPKVSIDVLQESALSWAAKGLYMFMAHAEHEDPEHLLKTYLLDSSRSGYNALTTAMRELEARGLIKRICVRSPKAKFKGIFWSIK